MKTVGLGIIGIGRQGPGLRNISGRTLIMQNWSRYTASQSKGMIFQGSTA